MLKRILIGILGFCVWVSLLQGIIQKQAVHQEHETHSARAWLDTLSSDKTAHVLFGSSNVAYSLDCNQLDSHCSEKDLTWYNLGQRGMRGYELMDFTMGFLTKIQPNSALKTVYIEASQEDWSIHQWNWRNAEILSVASITEMSLLPVAESEQKWKHWNALESMCQGMMMKYVAPVHALLYPSSPPSRRATKGFYVPPTVRNWIPNENEQRAMAAMKENQSKWDSWLVSEDKLLRLEENTVRNDTYPFNRLESIVEHCRQRNIEVRVLFIPTADNIHLYDSIASITGNEPIILGVSDDVRPFVTPEWMRDSRHLNANGIERVSAELGAVACQTYN